MPLGLKRDVKEGQYCSLHFLDKYWPIPAVRDSGKTPGNAKSSTTLILRPRQSSI